MASLGSLSFHEAIRKYTVWVLPMLGPSELWVSTRKYGVRAGLKTLASTLDQRWVCEELLLIWLYIHCDRDSEKQHKDTTQQELQKH